MDKVVFWKMLANEHKVKCKEYKNKYVWVLEYPYSESIDQVILTQDTKGNKNTSYADQTDNALSISHSFLNETISLAYGPKGERKSVMVGKRVDVPIMLRIILKEYMDNLSSERDKELAQEAIAGNQLGNLAHFFSDINNNTLGIKCELNSLVVATNENDELIPKGHILYKSIIDERLKGSL